MKTSPNKGPRLRLPAILLGWIVAEVSFLVFGIVIGLSVRDTNIADNLLFFLSGPAGASRGGYVPGTMGGMVGEVMRIMQAAANALYFLGGPVSAFLGGLVAGEMGRGNRRGGLLAGLLMVVLSVVIALGLGAEAADFLALRALLWWPAVMLSAWAGAAVVPRSRGVPV